MTTATAVTLIRLVALLPLAVLIRDPVHPLLALALFAGAAATDWADGAIARRWNQATVVGARLDALVDKVFIFALILLLWFAGVFATPVVILAFARDITVQVLRTLAPSHLPIPANRWGKSKFFFQCVGVGAALIAVAEPSEMLLRVFANVAVSAAVVVSLPGILLVWRARLTNRSVELTASERCGNPVTVFASSPR